MRDMDPTSELVGRICRKLSRFYDWVVSFDELTMSTFDYAI